MPEPSQDNPQKPLVSVEFQTEVNVATGAAERRMFVKMYFEARDSGLLGAIGDRRWRTLCSLATYMDENGLCYPSQARIGRDLGIHRQRVNERIRELLDFRFEGRPVITMRRLRVQTAKGGRWGNNVYRIMPLTGLKFGAPGSKTASFSAEEAPMSGKLVVGEPVSGNPDMGRPMSGKPDTVIPDTNEIQDLNETHTRVSALKERTPGDPQALVAYFHKRADHPASQNPTPKEVAHARTLLDAHGTAAARHIVDFAISKAPETNYKMRELGAVLAYAAEALDDFRRDELTRRRRLEERRISEAQDRRLNAERDAWARLSPEEKLESRIREHVLYHEQKKKRTLARAEVQALRSKLAREMGLDQTTSA